MMSASEAWHRASRCCAGARGSVCPATMSRTMRSPVTPVISLITVESWTFIWTRAFCMRWTCVAALCTRVSRWRRYARRAAMAAVGRKLPRSKPTLCSSWSHWQSSTSVFRPGTFLT